MDNIQKVNQCYICANECIIKEGNTGLCKKYTISNGELIETAPDKYLVVCGISIETMPMLHFHPKGKFLQITTTGCNLNCPGCISTILVQEIGQNSAALHHMTADQIIDKAKEEHCMGISFLMNDPIASYFTFQNVATKAKAANLLVGCSTNGYLTKKSAQTMAAYIDYVNIGLKGFSDAEYMICGAKSITPVLESIEIFYDAGIHIEVSCTYKKNDEKSVENFASWLNQSNYEIPLQIMRYIPLEGANPALEPTICEAEQLATVLKEKLRYVYLFNSPGTKFLNTYCHHCGCLLVERDFYGPMGAKTRKIGLDVDNKCPECQQSIPIKGLKQRDDYTEEAFEGGYPFTRGLDMIKAILIASGVDRISDVVNIWERMLTGENMSNWHHDLQSIEKYILSIQKFAEYSGTEKKALELSTYMQSKYDEIQVKLQDVTSKPRVYYVMGKPLFCLKGERFENQLVEAAGGISVNKEVIGDGRPGMNISKQQLNELNPEVIFISSFLSNSIDDFYKECLTKGIKVNAVHSKRIFTHTYPNWDFGSPRWILGLMNIANILHPELFHFDMFEEAEYMYREFYHREFDAEKINLSFATPTSDWHWRDC